MVRRLPTNCRNKVMKITPTSKKTSGTRAAGDIKDVKSLMDWSGGGGSKRNEKNFPTSMVVHWLDNKKIHH